LGLGARSAPAGDVLPNAMPTTCVDRCFVIEIVRGTCFLGRVKQYRVSLIVCLAAAVAVVHLSAMSAQGASEESKLVYIGTYTSGKSKGIYLARFAPASGLSVPELAAETKNPTFLALSPDRKVLYAVNEVGDFGGQHSGAVSAFSIEAGSGKLSPLNERPSGGSGPCHLAVDPSGKALLVANYGSGSVAAFRLEADGRLGEQVSQIQHHGSSVNPQRQEGPHAHYITADPGNRFAHLAFHPNGRWVYVINELGSTLSSLEYNGRRGTFSELQTVSTLPAGFKGRNTCAEVVVHPSGKFVYGSNRGDNSIAIFAIDPKTGKASFAGRESTRGKTPRHFALDPSGQWLLAENQDSDNVFVFAVDANTGELKPTGEAVAIGAPVCS